MLSSLGVVSTKTQSEREEIQVGNVTVVKRAKLTKESYERRAIGAVGFEGSGRFVASNDTSEKAG